MIKNTMCGSTNSKEKKAIEGKSADEVFPEYDAPGLSKAREALIYDRMSPGERKQYRDHLDEIRLQQDALDDSFEEGIAAGKKETARNLLKLGLDHKLISQATGLTEEEISKLDY